MSADTSPTKDEQFQPLRDAMRLATRPGHWDLYTSNSYRRIGIKGACREIVYAYNAPDGHPDISGHDDLAYAVEAANAAPKLLEELVRYENGRQILVQMIEDLKKKLAAAEQLAVRQANELRRLAKSKSQQKRYEAQQS